MSSRMSLYELNVQGREIDAALTESMGELTPELEARIDDILREGKDAIENACFVVTELRTSEEAVKAEAKRLRDRAAMFGKNADALRRRIAGALDSAFGGKIKTDRVTAYTQAAKMRTEIELHHSVSLEILRNQHPDFVMEVKTYQIDTAEVMSIWEKERPLRESGVDFDSAIPPCIAVMEVQGERFLQMR